MNKSRPVRPAVWAVTGLGVLMAWISLSSIGGPRELFPTAAVVLGSAVAVAVGFLVSREKGWTLTSLLVVVSAVALLVSRSPLVSRSSDWIPIAVLALCAVVAGLSMWRQRRHA